MWLRAMVLQRWIGAPRQPTQTHGPKKPPAKDDMSPRAQASGYVQGRTPERAVHTRCLITAARDEFCNMMDSGRPPNISSGLECWLKIKVEAMHTSAMKGYMITYTRNSQSCVWFLLQKSAKAELVTVCTMYEQGLTFAIKAHQGGFNSHHHCHGARCHVTNSCLFPAGAKREST